MKRFSLDIGGTPVRQMKSGVGASWHSMLIPTVGNGGSAMGGSPPVTDRHAKLWHSMEHHARWLGLKFIRLEMEWGRFEPQRGQYHWNVPEMKILDRICQWAQRHGSDVMLQCSWINADWCCFPEFRDDPALKIYSAAWDIEAWAKSWVVLLKELVERRGYTCIKWINLVNEPCCTWWFVPETADDFHGTHALQMKHLAKTMKAVRKAIRDAGLKVKLMGPGSTDLPIYPSIAKEPWFRHVDDVDFHSYCSNFDWDDPDKQRVGKGWGYRLGERMAKTLDKYIIDAHKARKGLYLTEFGTQTYGAEGSQHGPNTFKATLKDTELLIRCIQLGLDGLSHWSFVNRGDMDAQWQYIDTWGHWPKMWLKEARPHMWSYYVLGLATRHLPMQGYVLPTRLAGHTINRIPRIWSTALKSPRDGSTTILLVNDALKPMAANISGLDGKPFYQLDIHEPRKPEDVLKYTPVVTKAGKAKLELPAFGLTILTDEPLDSGSPGRM